MKTKNTILMILFIQISFGQVGIGTTNPNARLDVVSSNQVTPSSTDGILIPRVDAFPATNPLAAQNGMLVFLTTTYSGKQPGFYYWNQPTTSWVGIGESSGWQITGNSNTVSGTNYIGTSNNQALDFRVNGIRKLRLETHGNLATLNMGESVYIGLDAGKNDDLFENYNIGIGDYTLTNNTGGQKNQAIGRNALVSNTTGSYNVAIGDDALGMSTTGLRNIAIGQNALEFLTSGNGNIAIGNNSNSGSASLTNAISFGSNSYATSHQIYMGNNAHTSIGGFVDFTVLSDKRFKNNIKSNVPGLDFILKLNPVTYQVDVDKLQEFKTDSKSNLDDEFSKAHMDEVRKTIRTGFLAQDVEKVAKSLDFEFEGVDKPKDLNKNNYGLRYATFVVPLVKAVQEQQEEILKLKKELDELKKLINKR